MAGYTPRFLRFDLRARRISEQSAYPEESALVFSSKSYPMALEDEVACSMALSGGRMFFAIIEVPPESIDAGMVLAAGSLRPLLLTYNYTESIDAGMALASGELRQILLQYTQWPVESIDAGMALVTGSMPQVLIVYQNWPVESIDAGMVLAGGSLS